MARARASAIGTGARIFILILLVLVLLIGGLLWFDYLNMIDSREFLSPVLKPIFRVTGLRESTPLPDAEDPLLLDKERLKMQADSLALLSEGLDKREAELEEREAELRQMLDELAEKEKALEEREKSFNERLNVYENKRVLLRQKVNYFVGMPPAQAVAVLLEYDNDMDIIEIFRMADEMAESAGETSLVAYWISLMPPERGAELTRKMGLVIVE